MAAEEEEAEEASDKGSLADTDSNQVHNLQLSLEPPAGRNTGPEVAAAAAGGDRPSHHDIVPGHRMPSGLRTACGRHTVSYHRKAVDRHMAFGCRTAEDPEADTGEDNAYPAERSIRSDEPALEGEGEEEGEEANPSGPVGILDLSILGQGTAAPLDRLAVAEGDTTSGEERRCQNSWAVAACDRHSQGVAGKGCLAGAPEPLFGSRRPLVSEITTAVMLRARRLFYIQRMPDTFPPGSATQLPATTGEAQQTVCVRICLHSTHTSGRRSSVASELLLCEKLEMVMKRILDVPTPTPLPTQENPRRCCFLAPSQAGRYGGKEKQKGWSMERKIRLPSLSSRF